MDGGEVIRYIMTVLIVMILTLVAWNAFQDDSEMHEHHEFFDDVRAFMSRGGRNNEQQGYNLCKRTNALERQAGKPEQDCETIYPGAQHRP